MDGTESPITININRQVENTATNKTTQPFGYLNFIGLTSSEFLGGINARTLNSNSNLILSQMFKRRNIEPNSLRRALTVNPFLQMKLAIQIVIG